MATGKQGAEPPFSPFRSAEKSHFIEPRAVLSSSCTI